MNRRLGAALAVLAAAAAAVPAATAAGPAVRITDVGTAGFPQRVYVLALPAGQRLQPSRVSIQENGRNVTGLKVAPAGVGNFGTVLALDTSNSMHGRPIVDAMAATRAFAAGRNVNQRLGLLTFNQNIHIALPLSRSQSEIDRALKRTPSLGAGTRLYDAIAQAVALLQLEGVRAGSIVVLSDGHDTGSGIDIVDLAQHARASGIRVFGVGLPSASARPGALQQLSSLTGGSFSQAASTADLKRIFSTLSLRLSREYLVTYRSKALPAQPVNVTVSVAGLGSAKSSYVTPGLPTVPTTASPPSTSDRVWRSDWTMLLVAILIPLLIAVPFIPSMSRRGSTVRTRLSDFVSTSQHLRERKPLASRIFVGTERTLEKAPWWSRFTTQLELAGIRIPPVQIVVGTLVLTLFVMWVLTLISPYLALLALAVPFLVRALIFARIERRRRAFADQLADNLDVLASGLRAGHGLIGALAVVAQDAPEPSHSEFQRVVTDEQLGVAIEDSLETVSKRMKNRDLEQVALVASLQSETGGNAAEVLDRVTQTIRERAALRRLVRTLTAQGRLARWIVTALPVGLLIFISIANSTYIKPLFTHTSGLVALGVAGAMIVTGSIVIGRIVDIEV